MVTCNSCSACSFSLSSSCTESSFGAKDRCAIALSVTDVQPSNEMYSKQMLCCTSSLINESCTCTQPSNVSLLSLGQFTMICRSDSSVICVQPVMLTSSILGQCFRGERSVTRVQCEMSMMRRVVSCCSAVRSETRLHARITHDCNCGQCLQMYSIDLSVK